MSEQSLPVMCPENNTGKLTASFPGSLNDDEINKSLSGSIVFKYKQLHYLKGFILKNKSKLETISPASLTLQYELQAQPQEPACASSLMLLYFYSESKEYSSLCLFL